MLFINSLAQFGKMILNLIIESGNLILLMVLILGNSINSLPNVCLISGTAQSNLNVLLTKSLTLFLIFMALPSIILNPILLKLMVITHLCGLTITRNFPACLKPCLDLLIQFPTLELILNPCEWKPTSGLPNMLWSLCNSNGEIPC